jgi:hypothetical protein
MDELLNKLDKYLGGEMSKEDFDSELAKLSPDDKKVFDEKMSTPEMKKKLSDAAQAELVKVEALRKEGQRLKDKQDKPTDFASKMRDENVEKAKVRFFDKYKIPAEEQQHYVDLFKTNDSGHVSEELIYSDFTKIYSVEHSDELLGLKEKFENMEAGGEDFNARGAGAHGGSGSGGGDGGKKYSQEVMDWVKESARQGVTITPEQAEKVLNRGMKRTF